MSKASELVERLRDKAAHSAEAWGCEEYLPMQNFWASYRDLSVQSADLIESQQKTIEELREALKQARHVMWEHGFTEDELQPIRQALASIDKGETE